MDRKGNGAVEFACDAFEAMHAHPIRVRHRLLSRDLDGVFLGFDLQGALVDTWQLDDRQKIAALLKTLMGGKGPWPVVWSCSQSLAKRASSARCRLNNASNGSTKVVTMFALRIIPRRTASTGNWLPPRQFDLVWALALSRGKCQKFFLDLTN